MILESMINKIGSILFALDASDANVGCRLVESDTRQSGSRLDLVDSMRSRLSLAIESRLR